jgi:hypothetical protein
MSGLRLLFYYILYPGIAKRYYISSLANIIIKFNITSTSYHINPSFRKWEQKKYHRPINMMHVPCVCAS